MHLSLLDSSLLSTKRLSKLKRMVVLHDSLDRNALHSSI